MTFSFNKIFSGGAIVYFNHFMILEHESNQQLTFNRTLKAISNKHVLFLLESPLLHSSSIRNINFTWRNRKSTFWKKHFQATKKLSSYIIASKLFWKDYIFLCSILFKNSSKWMLISQKFIYYYKSIFVTYFTTINTI